MTNFDKAFSVILGQEGGYVDNKDDPGGETNLGITWPTLRTAIEMKLIEADTNIKNIKKEQSKLIYKVLYWDAVKADQLQWPLCLYVFDAAVNQGCDAKSGFVAQKLLQRVLKVKQDGILGVVTMAAAKNANHWKCARYMAYRTLRYTGTRNFDKFGLGWFTRCFDVAFKAGVESKTV